LVPADGFYEWQKFDSKVKQPWAIALKGDEPLAFAGLWDRWRSADKKTELESFSIITTGANEVTSPMHARMPVILMPRDYARWLSREDGGRPPVDLLRPYESERMHVWRVDAAVGNVKNNSAGLLEPVAAQTLF
jgi:putative SOS response-associated peptidase YedK